MATMMQPVVVDSHRTEMRIDGNAHDITRIKDACSKALKKMETERLNPEVIHSVVIHAPSSDEP